MLESWSEPRQSPWLMFRQNAIACQIETSDSIKTHSIPCCFSSTAYNIRCQTILLLFLIAAGLALCETIQTPLINTAGNIGGGVCTCSGVWLLAESFVHESVNPKPTDVYTCLQGTIAMSFCGNGELQHRYSWTIAVFIFGWYEFIYFESF